MEGEELENEELTPEEKARRVEEFFAKKRAQNEGREAVPGAEQMGSVAAAYAKGAVEGAATGALKGAGRAVKAGVGALVVDPLIGAAKLVGTPVRLLGWDGIHRMAEEAEKGWANLGADALDHGYEDWGTTLGDVGAKITGIAGMMGSFAVPGAAAAKLAGMAGKAAKAYNAALPFIFGNRAAVDTYDKAIANGQSTGRALAEAAADGAINFFGFKAFASKNLNRLLKIPEMQTPYAQRFVNEGLEKGVHGFSDMVKTVRNGSLSEILLSRAKGMLKAGGIMGLQEGFSSMAKQYAAEDVRPVEELSDEELDAALGQIKAWEAEQAAAEAEGRSPNTDLKPEWEKDFGDRLAVALKAGMRGMGEGAMMEGVMGAGEAALTMKEAREVTAGAIRKLIETPKGRAFLNAQNADAMGVVEGVAREGGTPTREQLDAAGLPPEMPMREVRRLAFDLKRDGEMAEKRAEMETEEYKKRAELAERWVAEYKEGEIPDFKDDEQGKADEKGAELQKALEEREERIAERNADAITDATQELADRLFGEDAQILVRRGTADEMRKAVEGAVGKAPATEGDAPATEGESLRYKEKLKDAEGNICGYWDRGTGEVVIFRNADVSTVAHELGWHATRNWAERNAPELLKKMNEYAKNAPPELVKQIEELYPDFARNPDALLDEIGAARFEKELGARFAEMLERSPEAKSWWQGLKELIAEAWRGMVRSLKVGKFESLKVEEGGIDLKQLEAMTPEEGMEWLVGQMAEGRRLGGGEAAKNAKNAKGAEVQGGEKPVKTVEVRNTGDGTLRFQIVRNGQKKTYKRPEEALRDFIAELDGVEMDAEQQGIYDVATGGRKTTDIRKDDLGNLIKLHRGGRGKGAQKIINVHYAGKRGKVTAKEVIDMGLVIREGALTFDGTPEHPASRRYEMLAEDGARLRVVVDLDKQGNEAVINLYSDRKDGNPGHKASSGAETTSQEEPANQAAGATEDGHAALTGERSRTVLHSTAPGKGSSDGADYSTGGGEKQVRPSIRGIFTGTAADYANRSREGGKDDGPSLKKIGSGEGSQVYGWGLYGSNKRGVAERYAKNGRGAGGKDWIKEGKNHDEMTDVEKEAASYLKGMGSKEAAIKRLKEDIGWFDEQGMKNEADALRPIAEELAANGHEYREQHENVYEQTFFTDRAPGDESHLLKWYEPVSEEQRKWIERALSSRRDEVWEKRGQAENMVEHLKMNALYEDLTSAANTIAGNATGEKVYEALAVALSPQGASEFLARAGIDGVKYPVDSYGGKTLKDGDEAGWNYVSFRDDNIRVDHKWTDGEIRYSRKLKPEEKAEVTADERKATRIGAEKALKALAKKPLKNLQTGIEAQINAVQRNKILSNAATNKSIRNGYTRQEHNAAAAIIERLWRYAEQVEMRPDRDGDANIRTIGRFIAPVYFTEREATAYITVKETRRDGHRIYSLELEKLEAPEKNPDASTPTQNGQGGLSPRAAGDTSKELGTGRIPANSEDGADYTTGGDAAQGGEIRPQIRLTAKEEIERTERALKAVREGRVRIADSGEAAGEASEPGRAASEELFESLRVPSSEFRANADGTRNTEPENSKTFVSLPMSGLLGLYRALRSNPSLPKVLTEAKRKGAAWVSRITKGSDVELNPEAFGIIDDTVREEVKAEMKAEGMFRNEDPVWNMKHSKRQCENERIMSEHRLEDRLNTLAQDITAGRKPGGNRVVTNALAHDIGQLIMAMPMSESLRKAAGKDGTAMIKDFKTLGEGVVKAVKKGIEIEEAENSRIGAEGEDRTFSQEVETVAWWRGEPMDDASIERIWKEKGEEGYLAEEAEWRRVKESLSKNPDEVAGELFGMFLAAPETLRAKAPKAYGRIVEAMGANETLMSAYSRIANADAPTEVLAKIEERQTSEAMRSVRQLKANLKKPLGTWWQKLKLEVARGIWSKESPAMMRIKWAAKARIGLAEEALKAAKKDGDKAEIRRAEANLELAKESAREMVEGFEHEIIMKHRNGGAGRQYMSELDSRVLGTLARAGLTLKDFDRYLKCKNVIANQGKAMDFGIVPQEAQRALDAQRSDLGEAKWKELERAAKEFHANRERNILEDANVKEMIGEMRLASWKRNSSYIRNERTLTAEEVDELNAAQFEPLTEKTKAKFRKNKETKNWELLTEPSNVARMKPVELDIETPVKKSGPESGGGNNAIRKAIEKIFGSFGKCRNAEDGEEVEFPGSSAGKMMFQSGADMSALAPHLKSLFEGATAAWYEPETRMEGHTYHPRVKGYRQYINRFSTKDGTEWYIRFTVREDKGASGRNDVHAATVSNVRLYKNAGAMIPANNTGRSSGEMPGATILANKTSRGSEAFVDRKISHFLSGVKTERAVDVVKEMDALIKLHQTNGVMGGDRFLKPLVGSFQPTEAPTEATAMHDLSLLECARENHYVAALADYATKMQLKGFAVVRDMRYKGVNAGERYGTRAFMKDGENFLLIMPKDVEKGFAKDPEAMQFLVELNRHAAKMLTTFSARFAVRNVARNREANENNIEWMRPSMLKEVMGALGYRPEARAIELAIERAVVRLPDWVIRNPVARLVWNEKTNMHFIAEADRIGKLLFTPGELRRVSEEADRLVKDAVENGGDVEKAAAKAKRLLAECEKARQIAKLPVFAGNFLKQMGYGGKNDVEGLFDRLEGRGSEAERLPYLGKIWKGAEWWMGKVQDFNTLEEARTKIAAYLSAEWQRSAAAAKGKRWKYGDDRRISDIIAMNSGSPMGELRGAWWNALETMVTGLFGNVSMKGAVRTIESAKRAPVEWSLKAVRRAENYAMRRILWGGGGMLLLLQAARRWFGDDEEAQRMLDVLEGYSKKMSRAFSMITDYRMKTYDIVPLALLGDDAVIGNCLPRGDEDKLLTPLVDYAVDAAMGTEAAKDAGLVEPLGGRYELGDLMGATFVNSGLLPDIERGGFSFKIIKDTFYSIFRNPYNLFTGRPTYDEKLWEQRGERKLEFTKEMLKQAWNDLGGQSILPLAQGPEDAEDVPDGMTAVWSATGEETTVSGGKTVFRLLHELPIGSAILSGFMFMNTKGQERITRRLLKMEEKRRAVLDHVAMMCLDCMGDNHSTGADYSQILENAREEYAIEPDEELAIIQAVTRKLVKFARLTGKENVPMRDLLNKEVTHPSRYRRMRNELIGSGWEVE